MATSKSTVDKVFIFPKTTRYPGLVILIDPDDEKRVCSRRWSIVKSGKRFYARSGNISLHRFILNAPDGVHVDHINGNGLDCRRANLRFATPTQNQQNARKRDGKSTSRYKGVCRDQYNTERPWLAYITVNKRCIQLGRFAFSHDAALAYDKAAIKHFGEFARLNFPELFGREF